MAYTFNPFSGNFDNAPFVPQVAGVYLPLSGGNITGNLQVSGTTTLSGGLEVGSGQASILFVGADKVGVNSESPNEALTVSGNISASGIVYGQIPQLGNYLPLSGGVVTGAVRFNDNVTIFGNLSCSGTQTFANTVFTTTSAVSVVHFGSGPAMWVGNNGDGDIASFYDIDAGVEILHVGGNTGDFPNVGVKTSNPNKDFTVNGEISANSIIYDGEGNSSNWNSVYSTVNSNSAVNWNYQGTDLKDLSANWQSTYLTVSSLSALWEESADIIPTVTNYLSTSNVLISGLTVTDSFSTVGYNSVNWDSAYSTVNSNSATTWNYQGTDLKALSSDWQNTFNTVQTNSATNWNYQGTDLKDLSANWESTYITVSSLSALWEESADIIPTVTNYLSTNNVLISSLTVTDIFSAVGYNSVNWDSAYSTVNSNSATTWNYQGTDLKDLSANWESTYLTVSALSALWEESADIIPTVTDYLSTNNILISSLSIIDTFEVGQAGSSTLYVSQTSIGINTESPNEALTVVGNISATGVLSLSSVTFTSETLTATSNVTATNTFLKIFVEGGVKYLRLFDL